jgi:hypothetical protein
MIIEAAASVPRANPDPGPIRRGLQCLAPARRLWAACAFLIITTQGGCAMTSDTRAPVHTTNMSDSVSEAETVVREYFSRMQTGDKEVYKLFHDDAVLNGLGRRTTGREAIRQFYSHAIDEGAPQPRLAAPLLREGNRVAGEIHIGLADGATLHVMDLFEVEAGRIRSLTYFLASEPPAP